MRNILSARAAGLPVPKKLRFDAAHILNSGHFVQFYESDQGLLESLHVFIGDGLIAGETAIVVATEEHRQRLDELLHEKGVDVSALRAAEKYVCLDAAETLSRILVDGSRRAARRDCR